MNFAPRSVYQGQIGEQKFTMNEYDFETRAGLDIANFLITTLACGIIAPFVSPLLCIFIILGFNGTFKIGYLICIFLSTYFLYDAYNGWLVMSLASFAFDEPKMNLIVGLNAGVLAINLFLLFFGGLMTKCIQAVVTKNEEGWGIYLGLLTILFYGAFIYAFLICKDNPDWVERNMGIGKYKIEQTI